MKKINILMVPILVAFMASIALPAATAFAHAGDPLSCSLVLFITDPGTDDVKVKKNHIKVKNSGQVAEGWVDCGDTTFDAMGDVIAAPDHPLDGYVVTDHRSKVKLDPATDEFTGKLKGTLTLVTLFDPTNPLTGKIKAKVSGVGLGAAMLGDPTGLVEAIHGKWDLSGEDIKAKGELSVGLAFDLSAMTLVGGGSLTGEMMFDGEDAEDGDDDTDD